MKIKKPKKQKLINQPKIAGVNSDTFILSLKHIDFTQGDKFSDWEEKGMLSKLMETIKGYSNDPLMSRVDYNKFTIYGDFPEKKNTVFYHPKHIPEDANWARIHINGKNCLIGHVDRNVFYAVFLDGKHLFRKSKLKNT